MVSILRSSALTESFQLLTIPIISFSIFLSWLPSVWLGTPHFGSPGSAGEENPGITSAIPLPYSESLPPSIFPDMFPEGYSFMSQLNSPDSSIWSWWKPTWSSAERVVQWPLSSCQACQDLQFFPVNVMVPERMVGRLGGRKRGWKAGSGILGSLRCDPYPSVLLWMPKYKKKNNPITVDPCTASKTQQQRLIKTERVPIPSFVFFLSVWVRVCVCVRVCLYLTESPS